MHSASQLYDWWKKWGWIIYLIKHTDHWAERKKEKEAQSVVRLFCRSNPSASRCPVSTATIAVGCISLQQQFQFQYDLPSQNPAIPKNCQLLVVMFRVDCNNCCRLYLTSATVLVWSAQSESSHSKKLSASCRDVWFFSWIALSSG